MCREKSERKSRDRNGTAPHAAQRITLVVVAKSPIKRIRSFARDRGWRNLRLLSSANNSYNLDYHGEDKKDSQLPALNVFARRAGKIHHCYCPELLFAPFDQGQDGPHVDLIWPLWNLFDFAPEGRARTGTPSSATIRKRTRRTLSLAKAKKP
jgi:predicted dithiol-disulfide oxidoreductase (DUF899 family)